jgi:hypothetical protein
MTSELAFCDGGQLKKRLQLCEYPSCTIDRRLDDRGHVHPGFWCDQRAGGGRQYLSAGRTRASEMFPAAGATDACIDTPLRLTFASAPTMGTGTIKVLDASENAVVQSIDVSAKTATQTIGGARNFNYLPIMIEGNEASITLPIGPLACNKTYLVTVDRGAFKTDAGPFNGINAAAGSKFTTEAVPPATGTTKLAVATDGTGDFCTVQSAVDFIPDGNTTRTTILLRKGTYTGLIFFANLRAVVLASPALSPTYDLRPAIAHVDGKLISFNSRRDFIILYLGTMIFGTVDNHHTAAAGRVGFVADPRDPGYSKLRQIAYDPIWAEAYGNDGGHTQALQPRFASAVIAPLLAK